MAYSAEEAEAGSEAGGLVWFSGFPEGFFGFLKTFGKTKKPNKTKPISKGGSETFKNFVFFWFSRKYFWFSLVFFGIFGFPEAFSRWSRCLGFRY